jgi:hypothetical protein
MSVSTARNARSLARRVAITVGAGYLLLVVGPVTAAAVLLVGSGNRSAGLGLLGLTVVATVACLTAAGLAWLLVGTLVSALDAAQRTGRLRLLRWAADAEATRPWARLVRPSARLAFLDDRSAEERVEDDVGRLKTRYVSGALSAAEFERGLDDLFETAARDRSPDIETLHAGGETVPVARAGLRHEPVDVEIERTVR